MNWMRKNGKTIGIITLALVAGVITFFTITFLMENRTVGFYYPDYEFKKLTKETRIMRIGKTLRPLEVRISEEYMLGPMNYELRMTIPDNLVLNNVWFAQTNKTSMIVISFNDTIIPFVENDPENSAWFIGGLIETLKSNSRVKQLLILSENRPIRKKVRHWNLEYPIILKSYQQ